MIKLYCQNENALLDAQKLVTFTNQINCCVTDEINEEIYLFYTNDGLEVRSLNFKPFRLNEFYRDFIKKRSGLLSKENLLQALNYNKLKTMAGLTALDLTGGLGRDTLILGLAGFKVTVVERNLYLACILNYLAIIIRDTIPHFEVIYQDSCNYLGSNQAEFTCIYYDPMFEDNKKALSKKDMQLIDLFVNYEQSTMNKIDNSAIYQLAKQCCHKLVVKRDNKQEFFIPQVKPTYQKIGKTVRFDVYQGDVSLTDLMVN